MSNRIINLSISEESGRRLKDPSNPAIFHFETYLPFTEAVKLERGNANVRPPKENHPFKSMMSTVKTGPEIFHLKNRGITYICDKFVYDNRAKKLSITIPNIARSKMEDDGMPRFGVADGGHTFKVVEDVVEDIQSYKEDSDWTEPYVRVHFLAAGDDAIGIDDVVEALNTSIQVKTYTIDEYRGKFDELKEALQIAKFDISHISFRENEDKEWHVTEIVQRLSCFLKERWKITPPSSMYRGKDKALQLFINDSSGEFKKLYPVMKDVITLPEFIQSALSDNISGARLGNVKGVKKQNKQFRRECTDYLSTYKMDGAIVLPMASAFRSLLILRGDFYQWKVSPHKVFAHCAADLYKVLLGRIGRVKSAAHLAADQEYWINCEKIVMNAREELEQLEQLEQLLA